MFKRNHHERIDRQARAIRNLLEQGDLLRAQLVAASREAERRYDAMQRDRDYWREQAKGSEL